MPRYYMHLRDHTDEVLDPEGMEMRPEAMPAMVLAQARDCMAGDVKVGKLDLRYRIDVEDQSGEIVHSLSFADALELIAA